MIRGATGFGLYDREVVDTLAQWREPEPFFRAMLVESGFALEIVPFVRPPRAAGVSKNNFLTLFDVALSGLSASSKTLLRAPFYLAAAMALLTGGIALGLLCSLIVAAAAWPWLLALLVAFNFTWIFLFLGVAGEQFD